MTDLRSTHEPSDASPLGVMDVGGSHARAAVLDTASGQPTPLGTVSDAIDAHAARDGLLGALLEPMRRLHRPGMPWTIAMPGPFDYEGGRGDFAGVGKFQSIAGVDLRRAFADGLGIPPSAVRFVNDAEAFAVGEWAVADDRVRRFVGITLGTGVGSAFLDSGIAVTDGGDVPPHGWAHLIEVQGEPLESRVSTAAIRSAYRARTGSTVTVREIADAAREGDRDAIEVLHEAMRTLGRALAPFLVRFAAEELVVGGAIARSWDLLEPGLRAGLQEAPGFGARRMRPSLLGEDAPLVGAAEWTRSVIARP
jgi:glucokinase